MKIRTCPDFKFLFEKKKIGLVQIFIYQLNISNLDLSRFKSGLVQIWNFWLKISNPDLSRFELRTRPNFFFQLKIWNLDLSRYQFWTSDSILQFWASRMCYFKFCDFKNHYGYLTRVNWAFSLKQSLLKLFKVNKIFLKHC